ncbi:Mitochondrial carrier protein LEU5 [Wickerhamiella sorbophila]|uniref:Mitochondrial carrier protein LEU5 n=1 Tax=Wickerhamiella sorbophila TaxID=45607 RepID=A0A2T0FNY9_9ASCO|nr:Mitochondrial carrier protein LEU5 [Wickerhamiella sorbophila]PRT56697.1 Mitochondrial carrier protein LEU5 [Wickerhamiella sorbophila]
MANHQAGIPDDCQSKAAPIDTGIEPIQKQTVDYVVRSGLAGGLAGCAAKTLIAPLDRVKILFQTKNPEFVKYAGSFFGLNRALSHIFSSEGALGLFRGHSVTLLRVFPYAAIKFVAYEQVRAVCIPSKDYETHFRRFLSGSISGVASVFCTYPLDVVRVQLAYRSHDKSRHRLLKAIKGIGYQASEKFRISNYYSGFIPTVIGMVPYAGVSFLAHDTCHDILRSKLLRRFAVDSEKKPRMDGKAPLQNWAELVAGGTSGMLAQTASYPLEIVRRRMQVAGINNARKSIAQTAATVFKESGVRGFFIGLSIGYIKVIPMFACSFFVYEKAKYLLRI